jgi:hypothetical protein
MKILKYLFILLFIAITGVCVYFSLQDSRYSITETKTINAPKDLIYVALSDFKNWKNWNPQLLKTGVTSSMGYTTTGIGGSYRYTDNHGTGTLIIKSEQLNKRIVFDKKYKDNMGSSSTTMSMDILPTNTGSKVIWTHKGEYSLVEKVSGFFLGKSTEKETRLLYVAGLNKLETYINAVMKSYTVEVLGIEATSESYYLGIAVSASIEKLNEAITAQKIRLLQYVNDQHYVVSGTPVVFYDKVVYEYNSVVFRVAIPVPICPNQDLSNTEITCSYKPASDNVVVLLTGDYSHLKEAMEKAERFVINENLEKSSLVPYELYLNDPTVIGNPAAFKTEVHIPIKKSAVYD